jgi:hypothetical protein
MLAYLFVVLAVAVRFIPHAWSFTPVTASLLFFGASGQRRSLWFPLALLAASDVFLTKVVYAYPFTWDHFVTWGWYTAVLLLGTRLRDNSKPLWIMASALASSVSFYLVSNFAVWVAFNMYPKTLSGLMMSYTMALPFFQRNLAGDLIFTAVMFTTPVVLKQFSERVSSSSGPAAVA